MIVNFKSLSFQNNRYSFDDKRVNNPSFGAIYPKSRQVPIAETKALYGGLTAFVTAALALLTKIYSDSTSENSVKLSQLQSMLGVDKKTIRNFVMAGYLQKEPHKYRYDINSEQNKSIIKYLLGLIATKSDIARLIDVNIHSINHHIEKGRIILDKDGRIDLSNPVNLSFCESFQKGQHMEAPISTKQAKKLLNEKAKQYFVANGFIKLTQEGEIDCKDDATQQFLKKYSDKEIKLTDYLVSVSKFAQLSGRTPMSIKFSILRKELVLSKDGTLDILNPVNAKYLEIYNIQNKTNPNFKTIKEVQALLGYKYPQTVMSNIKQNLLVREPNGMIDVSKEPNKSFIESAPKRISPKSVSNKEEASRKKKSQIVNETEYSTSITQMRMGILTGLTQPTIAWHISQGHIVQTNGKIDIKNPINQHFIKNHKRGKEFVTFEEHINPMKHIFVEKPKKKEIVLPKKNANETSKIGLTALMDITPTPITKNTKSGHLVLNDKNLYNLSDEVNQSTLRYYTKMYSIKIADMDNEELLAARERLKLYLRQYISRCHYNVSDKFILNKKEFPAYINYVTRKIVNTDNLNDAQMDELRKIVAEIIYDKVMDENFYDIVYHIPEFELKDRCNLYANELLLERLSRIKK